MTVAQETARPSTPPRPRTEAMGPEKQGPVTLAPPAGRRGPSKPPAAQPRRRARSPAGATPRTPTPSTRIDPSPAAAGTSSGRRSGGRVSPLGFPSLTSFPVWAGGGGATTEWEELSAREGSPPPSTSGPRSPLLPPQVGRGRGGKPGDPTGGQERPRLGRGRDKG